MRTAAEEPESSSPARSAGGRATESAGRVVVDASTGGSTITGSDGSMIGVVVGGAGLAVVGVGFVTGGFGLAVADVLVGAAVVGVDDDVVVGAGGGASSPAITGEGAPSPVLSMARS